MMDEHDSNGVSTKRASVCVCVRLFVCLNESAYVLLQRKLSSLALDGILFCVWFVHVP